MATIAARIIPNVIATAFIPKKIPNHKGNVKISKATNPVKISFIPNYSLLLPSFRAVTTMDQLSVVQRITASTAVSA